MIGLVAILSLPATCRGLSARQLSDSRGNDVEATSRDHPRTGRWLDVRKRYSRAADRSSGISGGAGDHNRLGALVRGGPAMRFADVACLRRGLAPAFVAVAFGLFAGSALAAGQVSFVRQFGGVGAGSGDLNAAAGLAVDPTTGNVLVADDDNERIDEFTSSGTFVKAWGAGVADGSSTAYETCNATATPCRQGVASGSAGGLNRPLSVAADASGDVFVADSGNNRIDEFDSSGTFVKAWGWGVTPGRSAAFQTCTASSTCQAGTSNPGDGGLASVFGVAVGSTGDVFVADYGASRVSVFDPSSTPVAFVRTWGWGVADQQQQFEICTSGCRSGSSGTGAGGQGGSFDGASGLTVDPSRGDVYVLDSLNYRVQQFHATGAFVRTWGWGVADGQSQLETCTTAASDSTGCQPGISGHGGAGQFANGIAQPVGIAFDATGNLDAVDQFNNRVQQFTTDGTFQNMFGYGVADGASGFENCTSSCQQGTEGTSPGELELPTGIATDTAGDIYVADGDVIEQYSGPVVPASPSAPTGLTAATASATEIDLGWNAVPGATGYQVLRGTTPGGPYTRIATPTGTTHDDTGLTPSTTYYYVVEATNSGGASANSSEASSRTSASSEPTVSTGGTEQVSSSGATLDATVNPHGEPTNYHFVYGTTTSYGHASPTYDGGEGATDAAVNGDIVSLQPSTTYHYAIVATNVSGTATGSDQTFTTAAAASGGGIPAAPLAPTGLAATANGQSLNLSWTASAGATGYQVLRGTSSGAETLLDTSNANAYTDRATTAGAIYYYEVRATNAGGTSDDSNEASATTASGPPTPHTLAVSKDGAGSGTVTSSPSGINCVPACSTQFPAGTLVTLTATADSGFSFGGWSGGGCSGTRTCQVTMSSDQAVTATFVPTSSPPTLDATTGAAHDIMTSSATLSGLVDPQGMDAHYWFQYGTTSAYGSATSSDDAGDRNGFVGEVTLTGLPPATTYHYRIVAQQGSASPVEGAERSFTTAAAPPVTASTDTPASLSATSATLAGTIDPQGGTVSYYFRYGRTAGYGQRTSGGTVRPAGGNQEVSEDITGLSASTTYHYELIVGDGSVLGGDQHFTTSQAGVPTVAFQGPPQQHEGSVDSLDASSYAAFAVVLGSDGPGSVRLHFVPADGSGPAVDSAPASFSGSQSVSIQATIGYQQTFGQTPAGPGLLLGDRNYVVTAVATTESGTSMTSTPLNFTAAKGDEPPLCRQAQGTAALDVMTRERGVAAAPHAVRPDAGIPQNQGKDSACGQDAVTVVSVTSTTAELQWAVGSQSGDPDTAPYLDYTGVVGYGLSDAYGRTATPTISGRVADVKLSNLASGAVYHAHLDLGNADGFDIDHGRDVVFATSPVSQVAASGTVTKGTVTQTASCPSRSACSGTVVLYQGTGGLAGDIARTKAHPLVVLGRGKFKIPAHKHGAIQVRLNAAGKRLARRRQTIAVTEVITTTTRGHAARTVRELRLHVRP